MHYLTANSCYFPGYQEYDFPAAWGSMDSGVPKCRKIPEDGDGAPEQFWNCAEVNILPTSLAAPTTPSPVYPLPAQSAPTPTYPPASAPVIGTVPTIPTPDGSCGAGNIGNGRCADSSLCCSKWGYCGSSDAHCSETAPVDIAIPAPTPATQTPAPTSATHTPAPTSGSNSSPIDDWVLSTESRCGSSEADARGNCRQTCDCSGECGDGEYCWKVYANYCGSKPAAEECTNEPKGLFACGTSELMARETCGATCSNDEDCNLAGGETCYDLNLNFCGC